MDHNQTAVALFNKLAGLYEQKYMNVDAYADSLNLFCSSISKRNPEILELACGPGNVTRYLLNRRADFKVLATDLAPNMLELAKANNPQAEFALMDCRDMHTIEKKYDAIMCGFCLPYFSKEEALRLIGDAANLLLPEGIFYLSTMEGDYAKSGLESASTGDQVYMYYHEAGYLTQALLKNNFKIIDTQRLSYPGKNGTTTTDLILIATKQNPIIL